MWGPGLEIFAGGVGLAVAPSAGGPPIDIVRLSGTTGQESPLCEMQPGGAPIPCSVERPAPAKVPDSPLDTRRIADSDSATDPILPKAPKLSGIAGQMQDRIIGSLPSRR